MPIRGKLVTEISPTDILDLIQQRTPEDPFLEFKAELLDPRKPSERLDIDRADWVADLVAFANSGGGHIIIGMEADDQERASALRPMVGYDAKKLASTLRDLAIAHIKPHVDQLEVHSFEMTSADWIVIAAIPDSQGKPHMSSYNQGTRFAVRDGNRKREMTYGEIQDSYLKGPQQHLLSRFMSEVESINDRLGNLERDLLNIFRKVN